MLVTTRGLVLRSVKYGESSVIATIFTGVLGVRSYIIKGVRTAANKRNQAGMLQATTVLEIVAYHNPENSLQNLKEFSIGVVYTTLQEDIVKTSIAFFCTELLLRLLPANSPAPELFRFAEEFLTYLDQTPTPQCGNMAIYFIIMVGRNMGYEISGEHSEATPYVDVREGRFSDHAPPLPPYLTNEETKALSNLHQSNDISEINGISLNGMMRNNILEWYVAFMQRHTQHMGSMHSLQVLKSVFHE